MRTHTITVLLILAAAVCMAMAQAPPPGATAALRIVSPTSGEKNDTGIVTVRYELAAPASAASIPTFQLRLDNQDPVQTSDTQYTFTGLTPGVHSVTVQLVDANGTPIQGAQSQVQFTVVPQKTGPQGSAGRTVVASSAQTEPAAMRWQEPAQAGSARQRMAKKGDQDLPKTGSPLPLLSVIGMGVLLGGIASALRTRHSTNRSH